MSCKETCQNGYCLNFGDGNLVCTCKEGWEGANCDVPIIKCKDTCQYGRCVREKCVCYTGWRGENCDTSTRTCEDTCIYGRCVDKKCVCHSDYKGEDCDIEKDCLSSKCKNGSCVDEKCVCTGKWIGKNCDKCPQDYLLIDNKCVAPGTGVPRGGGTIPYMNTCLTPGDCKGNTTLMERCNGTSDLDSSYCAPNEIWCDNSGCWGPNNKYSGNWLFSNAKSDVISCDNAQVSQNLAYPDRSDKNPNLFRVESTGCRQGWGYCGARTDNFVAKGKYTNPSGGPEYHKITHWLWPDTFQSHCVLKSNL